MSSKRIPFLSKEPEGGVSVLYWIQVATAAFLAILVVVGLVFVARREREAATRFEEMRREHLEQKERVRKRFEEDDARIARFID
jgi:hypothetical protein